MHHIVDRVWLREHPEFPKAWPWVDKLVRAVLGRPGDWDEAYVMTSWHDDETLDEALWYAVFCAYTSHGESTVLAVVSPQYAEQVEQRLADTEQLSNDVVDEEPT